MIGLKIKRRWQRNCICCQRFFLFRSFFLYPVSFFFLTCFIPLFIPESKNFYPSCPIFLYSFCRQRYNNGVTFFFLIFASLFFGWKSGVLWHVDTKDPRSRLRVTPGMVSDVCHGFLAGPSVYFELFFLLALSSWAWRYPLVSIISFGRLVIAPSVSG